MKRFICKIILGCLISIVLISGPVHAITILEEHKLAQKFMAMIKRRAPLLEDPIVTDMVNRVGHHLLRGVKDRPFPYRFYVVDEDVFNAFAGPGANIFFYRGLITSLDNIDEFAGIVGHEIAHAASRHVAESVNRSKYANLGALAGMLAGAIIGSTGSTDAGSAVLQSSIALTTSAMLAFTRENETEADEKGVMFLKQSCFSPHGLMGGLMKIREADFRGVEAIPEYVKTHPGTGNRIAHAEGILAGYESPESKPVCPDFRFDMVKYRLLGLYSNLDQSLNRLEAELADGPETAALHYGLGFLYERKFMPDKAMTHFKKALSLNIFDSYILLEMARLHLADGDYNKALQILAGIDSEPVIGTMAKFHQASAQLELRKLTEAEKGFKFVLKKQEKAFPQAYLKLANVYSLKRNQGLTSYNLGLYYHKTGKQKTAVVHLGKALEHLPEGSDKKRAKSLMENLKKELARQKLKQR